MSLIADLGGPPDVFLSDLGEELGGGFQVVSYYETPFTYTDRSPGPNYYGFRALNFPIPAGRFWDLARISVELSGGAGGRYVRSNNGADYLAKSYTARMTSLTNLELKTHFNAAMPFSTAARIRQYAPNVRVTNFHACLTPTTQKHWYRHSIPFGFAVKSLERAKIVMNGGSGEWWWTNNARAVACRRFKINETNLNALDLEIYADTTGRPVTMSFDLIDY